MKVTPVNYNYSNRNKSNNPNFKAVKVPIDLGETVSKISVPPDLDTNWGSWFLDVLNNSRKFDLDALRKHFVKQYGAKPDSSSLDYFLGYDKEQRALVGIIDGDRMANFNKNPEVTHEQVVETIDKILAEKISGQIISGIDSDRLRTDLVNQDPSSVLRFDNRTTGADNLVTILEEQDWLKPEQLNIFSRQLSQKLPKVFPEAENMGINIGNPLQLTGENIFNWPVRNVYCPVTSFSLNHGEVQSITKTANLTNGLYSNGERMATDLIGTINKNFVLLGYRDQELPKLDFSRPRVSKPQNQTPSKFMRFINWMFK